MYIGNKVVSPRGDYEAEVLVSGAPQPLYRRMSDGKVFVAGPPDSPYTLRVSNKTSGRLEIVNAIDQRNTSSDEPASLDCRGMLVPAHGAITFEGWRLNNSSVGQFVFGQPAHSVSAQATSDTSKVGIIGFAAYAEERRPSYGSIPQTFGGLPPKTSIREMGGLESLGGGMGTGIGDTVASHVTHTAFNRSHGSASILEIGYDTEGWLTQQGIIAPAEPEAFPVHVAFASYARAPRA